MAVALPVKITRPKSSRLTERPRLFAALDEARHGSATWMNAPPGFGKTSLASNYREQRELDCLWYRMDAEDADVGSFFYYLKQAGDSFPSSDGDLPAFTPENLLSLDAFGRRFFEKLHQRLPSPALLVFDDYQDVAADAALHGILAKAVEHLPDSVHVLFLSREPPPPAFTRLHGHGAFAHIDGAALQFTQEEAQALGVCKKTCRGQDEIFRLNELAGGWAAGLTLLLEPSHQPFPERRPDTATLQMLFDYFSQEIFRNLDLSTQTLLLKCALLPEMPIAVVEQVTDSEETSHLLATLSAKNYFTTRHDNGDVAVYRFHPLFRTFLRAQAEKILTHEALAALQKKAALALAHSGYTEDAVTLLHACAEWPTLTHIILTHAEQLARQGRLQTLVSWIQRLPEPVIEESPWLLFWLGSCQLTFDPMVARATLQRAYALFDAADDATGLYLSWAGVATVYLFAWFDSQEALVWIAAFEDLRRRHPDFPSPAIEARATVGLVSLLRLYRLDHSQLLDWINRCRTLLNTIDDHTSRLLAASELTWCYSWLGKIAHGGLLLRELAHLATDDTAPLVRLNWLTSTAMNAWHRADAVGCADTVAQALHLADESDSHAMDLYICLFGVYGALTVGNAAAAQALQPRITDTTLNPRNLDVSSFHHVLTLVNLHLGNFHDAEQHARQALAASEEFRIVFLRFIAHLCLAGVLLELGKLNQAAEHFEHAARWSQGINSAAMTHLCQLGNALLAFKRGHPAEALAHLGGAIENAKIVGGHYTPFYYRETLSGLYVLGLDARLDVDYLQNQIRLQRLVPPSSERAPENWSWPVKIYTLGRFAIAKDGVALTLHAKSSRKPVALLKTLIAHGGRDVHQDKFIAALWQDADDGHHAFETTVYRLRKLLGAEVVLFKDGHLSLDARHCWVDCWAFARLLTRVTEAIEAADDLAVAQHAQQLLDLYQGPFLDRDRDSPVAIAHSERLRSHLLRTLEKLAHYWTTRENHPNALECYLRALEVEPRAEPIYQRLIQHYHAQGRYPEAIAVYQRCRLALHSLLGVTPSPSTHALYAAVLAATHSPQD